MTLNPASQAGPDYYTLSTKKISYPSGLNKNNCIPIAFLGRIDGYKEHTGWAAYSDQSHFPDSISMVYCSYGGTLILEDDGISIRKWNMTIQKSTYLYKIVLMKIS